MTNSIAHTVAVHLTEDELSLGIAALATHHAELRTGLLARRLGSSSALARQQVEALRDRFGEAMSALRRAQREVPAPAEGWHSGGFVQPRVTITAAEVLDSMRNDPAFQDYLVKLVLANKERFAPAGTGHASVHAGFVKLRADGGVVVKDAAGNELVHRYGRWHVENKQGGLTAIPRPPGGDAASHAYNAATNSWSRA